MTPSTLAAVSGLILSILPLAAGAAVSPTVLVVGLSLVASPQGATRRLIAFTAGATAVLVVLSALSLALAHRTGGIHTTPDEVGTVQLVVAALLFALGVRTVIRPPSAPRERPRDTGSPRLWRSLLLGAGIMSTNVVTLCLSFTAVHLIGVSDADLGVKAVAFIVLFLIVLLPAEVPLAASRSAQLRDWLTRVMAALVAHQRTILPLVEFGLAAYLTVLGLINLL